MLNTKTNPRFYTALEQAMQSSSQGPINLVALLQHKNLVLEKASSLLGYQTYLTQARGWKAAQKGVSLEFEREVQTQAAQALSDTRDFALAVLQTTKHLKQAGALDHMLDTWIAGLKASGSVQVQDLWSDLANDPEARQILRDQGWTDDLWTALDENMKKLDGRLVLQDGKLAAEVKLAGQGQRVVLTHSASGAPRTLGDLLKRGQFERMVEQFERQGALWMDVVASETDEFEMVDVVLGGAVRCVQGLAQHKRKLEDTGLATYAGNELVTILGIAGLLALITAAIIQSIYDCSDASHKTICQISAILLVLALALIMVGATVASVASSGSPVWTDECTPAWGMGEPCSLKIGQVPPP